MRLPIRIRLTAWYAALLAVIIAVLGGFVVWQLRSDLQNQVDGEIRATSGTLIRAVRDENRDTPPDEPISSPEFVEDFAGAARAALTHRAAAAQVIGPNGDVLIRYGPAAEAARWSRRSNGRPLWPAAPRRSRPSSATEVSATGST